MAVPAPAICGGPARPQVPAINVLLTWPSRLVNQHGRTMRSSKMAVGEFLPMSCKCHGKGTTGSPYSRIDSVIADGATNGPFETRSQIMSEDDEHPLDGPHPTDFRS